MGSQPSTIEVPEGHKIKSIERGAGSASGASSAPSTKRQQGFQEVELTDSEAGSSSTPRTKKKTKKKSDNWEKVTDQVNLVTDGNDTDFHSVVNKAQTKKQETDEFDQPQYSVSVSFYLFIKGQERED